MIILIDNYDSFTFNVYHYLSELGAKVKGYRNDEVTPESILEKNPKAIIISPGPKTPNQAGICLDLIKLNKDIPVLGICLGHQSIGQAYGGLVVQADEIKHGKIDEIIHFGNILFEDINEIFEATRYHSLIIEKKTLPKDLEIIAETKNKKLYIQAGGGIVYDSDPEKEYQETINKANALIAASVDSYKYS